MEEGRRETRPPVNSVRWSTTTPDGTVYRYENGLLHCDTGPAVIYADGRTECWLFGTRTLLVPARASAANT